MTLHVARKAKGLVLDGRTRRHAGDAASLRRGKLLEEAFPCGKTIAGMSKVKVRGLRCARHAVTFAMAAYNLTRMPRISAEAA